MRARRPPLLAIVALLLLAAAFAPACAGGTASPEGPPPNIVLIVLDDADAASVEHMPKTQRLLVQHGASFERHFVSTSLCCPSRATMLRGQYAHNHGVLTSGPPNGSFSEVYELKIEESTLATWLQEAGYRTALFGKYFNRYPITAGERYVPPGWDEWHAVIGSGYRQYLYELNDNGTPHFYGGKKRDFGTDVLSRKAASFIRRASGTPRPFFMYVAPLSPHWPSPAARRHQKLFPFARVPRTPAYNELDLSDKPAFIRRLHPVDAGLDGRFRDRLRSLQAVDDLVANVVQALVRQRLLNDTVILFTSDNGFMLGEHRIGGGKRVPYEESIRVPLIIRGPGVPQRAVIRHLTGNVDLAPTIAELAGIDPPDFVDGRSLLPLLGDDAPSPDDWRQAYLLEYWPAAVDKRSQLSVPRYSGIRARHLTYVEYATGERELYDLRRDPHQLDNIAQRVDDETLETLSEIIEDLQDCEEGDCRDAEESDVPPLPAPE